MTPALRQTLAAAARFYDARKKGNVGPLGFRRSTDLIRLLACLDPLVKAGILRPGHSTFLDLGAADGRVNVFMSYLTRVSVGVELDEWTLDEYAPLRAALEAALGMADLLAPPHNVYLLQGDSTDEEVHQQIARTTGVDFQDVDLFYTYLTMHEEFAALVAQKARRGSIFMVYGMDKILPRYPGLRLLDHLSPLNGILALYEKG